MRCVRLRRRRAWALCRIIGESSIRWRQNVECSNCCATASVVVPSPGSENDRFRRRDTVSVQTVEKQSSSADSPRRCGFAVRVPKGEAGRCSDVRACRSPETAGLTQMRRWFQVKRRAIMSRWLEGQGRPTRSDASQTNHCVPWAQKVDRRGTRCGDAGKPCRREENSEKEVSEVSKVRKVDGL